MEIRVGRIGEYQLSINVEMQKKFDIFQNICDDGYFTCKGTDLKTQ
jgi:hypothetical protein